ncbi:hypothetical protein D3C86_2230700 [compost metagenome]
MFYASAIRFVAVVPVERMRLVRTGRTVPATRPENVTLASFCVVGSNASQATLPSPPM